MRPLRWLVWLPLLLLFLVGAVFAQTPEPTPSGNVVLSPDIFVRGGPGRTYIPVGGLKAGDALFPVSRNTDATWILIRYNAGFGWIRRDLAFWQDDVDVLPVMLSSNLTPSPMPGNDTATPFFATATPEGNWVNVGSGGAFVRAGPGRGYLRIDTLYSGDVIEDAVGRNEDTSWVMFRDGNGFAWISRLLVNWVDDLESLPILLEDALTPSPTFTASPTATATATASATSTPTSTYTATSTLTPTPTSTATFTATPSPTLTPTPTLTNTPRPSDTAAPRATATYTATVTVSQTPSVTASLTATPSATATNTATPRPSMTPSHTPVPSATWTDTPSATPSETLTLTATIRPSATAIPSLTATTADAVSILPTEVPSASPTMTASPSSTATETATPTMTPTVTASPTRTSTLTDTPTATLTSSATATPTQTPSRTATNTEVPPSATPSLTATEAPSVTPTVTVSPSDVPSETPTATTEVDIVALPSEAPPATLVPQQAGPDGEGGAVDVSPEAIIGVLVVALVMVYIAFYFRGAAAADRYAAGFVIEQCPVCQRGTLSVETRQDRLLGIPRARRSVHCDECRSVLRETGYRQWRYAVDPVENAALYERYNGHELDEETLVRLVETPVEAAAPRPRPPFEPPTFVDHDEP